MPLGSSHLPCSAEPAYQIHQIYRYHQIYQNSSDLLLSTQVGARHCEAWDEAGRRAVGVKMDGMAKDILTTAEAAKILGVSVRTAQLLIEGGSIPSWKTPGVIAASTAATFSG